MLARLSFNIRNRMETAMLKIVSLVLLVTCSTAAPPESVNPPAGPHKAPPAGPYSVECNETQPCGDGGICLPLAFDHPSQNGIGSLVCVNVSGTCIISAPEPTTCIPLCAYADLADPAMICEYYMPGTSPGSCSDYPEASETMMFTAPAGMQVQMLMHVRGIECHSCEYDCALGESFCPFDQVQVFDGATLVETVCGGGYDYSYTSTGGSISISTDANNICNDKGFIATIQYV